MKLQPGNDWYFIGPSTRRYFEYPGRVVEKELALSFQDGLKEIIPEKLKELLSVQDELLEERRWKLNKISKIKNITTDALDFNIKLIEFEFAEYDVVQKWIKYWLRLMAISEISETWTSEKINGDDFSPEEIGRAKQVRIEELFEGKLRKIGSRYVGLCPFHKEDTASFTIFEDTNSFFCFGCQKSGDVIDYYSKINECSFPQAVKELIKNG